MPQLQIGDFAPQLVWLAIVFTSFYLVMARIALPRIGSVLDERKARIEGDLAEAQRLRDETKAAIAAYEQALIDARAEAHSIIGKTREDLNAKLRAERAEIEKQIAAKIATAEARISEMKAKGLSEIHEIAAETAGAVVEKLIGVKTSKADVAAMIPVAADSQ